MKTRKEHRVPGPSPRVRGIPRKRSGSTETSGSIPAGAGNPSGGPGARRVRAVHPRGCGESPAAPPGPVGEAGPSPRVRGIHAGAGEVEALDGSIPAGAGNPRKLRLSAAYRTVHPRGCGESHQAALREADRAGPSPRVRGIHPRPADAGAGRGSIPAGAGNPRLGGLAPIQPRVHPRGCGESVASGRVTDLCTGPSPRVRGIRGARHAGRGRPGSIPAGAGNPPRSRTRPRRATVHPRGCGESGTRAWCARAGGGPSPRVRGIRVDRHEAVDRAGSIPAGAGNPLPGRGARVVSGVHPRGCGESVHDDAVPWCSAGPSPRVRGILRRHGGQRAAIGSIPAGAGNPGRAPDERVDARVHPRGCGESAEPGEAGERAAGPSPRVRGIQPRHLHDGADGGSIPAGAGNPDRRASRLVNERVHPRGCGES